ncbi:Octanoate-[acyl-carrier-protein]-protein-N-octanoyltransferase [Alloactinosynnema sp. L-07]|uniref:lipoyl(octanoyl) transferase LipB n=1 Tax=Alloactinosynnema sp. L-07 TaxID=1653480 RepID=UPI00065F0134|nr:lipoyl(octanoyl) transferase LipB [Alloactinosynnema sp. L-07]CRK55655.1 Octanoate-[acyl-carrier-protein]-protein-N-octanoyltransferase [Alloactinosynnema sp. L-07]
MSTANISCRADGPQVEVREVGLIDYVEAWDLQKDLAGARADDLGGDTLLLLEHPSVYTAGKRTEPDERPDDGTPVIDVDRGGKITWHGPGQLVGYPIIKLSDPVDVVQYVRRVEEALISVCATLGLRTGRVEGRSGVWLPADATRPERKIAAIGIRVQRGVTMHGFEINCDADLSAFDRIVPCGIRDAGVTSLTLELGRQVSVAEVLPLAREAVLKALEGTLPVADHWLTPAEPTSPGVTFALS